LFLITAYHRNVPAWGWVLENRTKPYTTPSVKVVDDDGYQKSNTRYIYRTAVNKKKSNTHQTRRVWDDSEFDLVFKYPDPQPFFDPESVD
jgi:hypothetical protein